MAINNINTNYTDTLRPGIGQAGQTGQVSQQPQQSVVISGGSVDLSTGQTFSGQVVNIDGKDIKLLLSNGQTINASLEGNIRATLGQILSLEVTSNDNGKMALRPLYTNLNNSSAVRNALMNAHLPNTENYGRMVDSMMNQGMPINKDALNSMAQKLNTFPNANPETLVELSKLNIPINEVTINQYENYKGLEHQIINDVMNLTDGLTELLDESLNEAKQAIGYDLSGAEVLSENPENVNAQANTEAPMSKLLNAFLNALNGGETDVKENTITDDILKTNTAVETEAAETSEVIEEAVEEPLEPETQIPAKSFDVSRQILNLVDENSTESEPLSNRLTTLLNNLSDEINAGEEEKIPEKEQVLNNKNTVNIQNENQSQTDAKSADIDSKHPEADTKTLFNTVKNVLNTLENHPEAVSNKVKQRLTELLSDKEFSSTLKNTVSKQMLLKPEDVTSSKNIEDLYSKITRQANQAMEVLTQSGKDNPALAKSAANINDNVNFMNQLNQAVTYVQIPLLMNNKSAHGDLYVYTKKKNLMENDGNVSALLHLDMDNLGPMDVYVSLTNATKVNTHFYLQDDATIDFIEQHIDLLNEKLARKGYDTTMQVSVKDTSKGPTRMTDEFMKNDPDDTGINVSKFSFDVRA